MKLFHFFIYYQICGTSDVYHYVIASVGIQIYQLNQNETIFTTDFHSKFRLFGKKNLKNIFAIRLKSSIKISFKM